MYHEADSRILRFSPSDLTVFLETEFASWMDRWDVEQWNGNSDVVGASGLPIELELPEGNIVLGFEIPTLHPKKQ